MFHCFKVRDDHRNYLRFLWYANNDPQQRLVDYRMRVHVFGNTTSPAVAMYGLRRTAQNAETVFGSDVRSFVERNFYVDDGLISLPSAEEAVSLMQRTQQALQQEGGLRLHKIASNSKEVMNSFPTEDLAKDLMPLDLVKDNLPVQRSLGLIWDLRTDSFTFKVSSEEKPYTRRGVLSCLNSFYDPLGFVAPVLIRGKLMLRNLISDSSDWDEPLPEEYRRDWESWRLELRHLENVQVPRPYLNVPSSDLVSKEVHVYTDASEDAIAAVAYLRAVDHNEESHQGFILGKAKVAPKNGVTIPRLELCAAVLGIEIAEVIRDQLDIPSSDFRFHTDSKVVLGYIYNRTRRFYTYVSNRVQRIRKFSQPEQWCYVPSEYNPADQATRSIPADSMSDSSWIRGSSRKFPRQDSARQSSASDSSSADYDLIDSETDKEIRPVVTVSKTSVDLSHLGTNRFSRFSTWKGLVSGIVCLKHIAQHWNDSSSCSGWHACSSSKDVNLVREVETLIIREVQSETYQEEIACIRAGQPISRCSPIVKLNPIMDADGLLRVGGRLSNSDLDASEKTPLIIPGKHHAATLLFRHHHELAKHQGRHFTEGAIRSAGLWITGAKRLVTSVLHKCVRCCRARGKVSSQKMADLPEERLQSSPPFTYVGVDCFGPWEVTTRKTRGGSADSKRWAVLFTCMCSRAVHH